MFSLAPGTARVSLRVGPGPQRPVNRRGRSRGSNIPPASTGQTIHTMVGTAAAQPDPQAQVEPQAQSANQRSPEPGGPLRGDRVEEGGADESAAGPGQERAGDGQPEAVRGSRQEETQGQDPGARRQHPVGRAPVQPDGRGRHEPGCQAAGRGEQTDGTGPRWSRAARQKPQPPRLPGSPASSNNAATTSRRPSLRSGWRLENDASAITGRPAHPPSRAFRHPGRGGRRGGPPDLDNGTSGAGVLRWVTRSGAAHRRNRSVPPAPAWANPAPSRRMAGSRRLG